MTVSLRTSVDPISLVSCVRSVIQATDADLPITELVENHRGISVVSGHGMGVKSSIDVAETAVADFTATFGVKLTSRRCRRPCLGD